MSLARVVIWQKNLFLQALKYGRVTIMDRKERFRIKRYANLQEMKVEEYDYWKSRPAQERMDAVTEITTEAYGLKDSPRNAPRLRRAIIHLKR